MTITVRKATDADTRAIAWKFTPTPRQKVRSRED